MLGKSILILYSDSPDDPQMRTVLAQLEQVTKLPVTILPLYQLGGKQRKANVQSVLPTLASILPN
ncbi:hypothetical protein Q5H93_04500 [Hymenobacter sp. ASUV-10]|uniref:KaiB domain-containing protein n=1 Tax=Hymenobacter aranciens TaxID=3063996 RepID=A0ABT9B8E9_9BACT|nr:hypothetical protein [Hymenobacter sp. ASUV-10]MDO7873984.1 hypothetical protein [Hymenobacter sp. ASUV-10]